MDVKEGCGGGDKEYPVPDNGSGKEADDDLKLPPAADGEVLR